MSLTVRRLGRRGDGVADGPVHAPRTLPGEEISGEVVAGRMPAPRIVRPAAERVRPPCPHFGACGGCALQHASDGFVAAWKLDRVHAALAGVGLAAPMRPIHVSPPESRRRAALAGRRTKRGAVVGFHGRASGTIAEIPDCRVLHPDLVAALPALEALTRLSATRKGEVTLHLAQSAAGVDVAVEGDRKAGRAELADLAATHDLARLARDGEVVVERDAPAQRFGRAEVVPPPGAFLQATRDGEAALVRAVRQAVGEARRVFEAFAGCGTFTLPLAERAELHAADGNGAMLAALDRGWRGAPGLKRVVTEVRDLLRDPVRAGELDGVEAAVLDPPRSGARAQTEEIAASGVRRVAAVSCSPETFAREGAILAGAGFALDWVQVVDQFRWSPHIELAAQFSRGRCG